MSSDSFKVLLIFHFACQFIVMSQNLISVNASPRQDLAVTGQGNNDKLTYNKQRQFVFNTKAPNMNALILPSNNTNASCVTDPVQDEQDRYLNRITLILLIVLFVFYVVSLAVSIYFCYLLYKRNRHFY
jgi:hypothetical protein